MIAAVPAGKGDYKPHEKNMSGIDLAWHIAQVEVWFLQGLADGAFATENSPRPAEMNSGEAIAAWYDKNVDEQLPRVKALPPEQLAETLNFFNVFNNPRVVYLQFMLNHSIHHRGQLSAYLRPMGAKVPSIYGGSADEPFEMPEQAANA